MAKKEFLQLCQTFDPKKHSVAGWFLSEKLDGQRAFWDGGVSRGQKASVVPWSNTRKDKDETIATGLWSRYGKIIYAPEWWLDEMPKMPLDGELWCGRNSFQTLESVVRNKSGTSDWTDIQYLVFDSPPAKVVFGDREIKNANFERRLTGCYEWVAAHAHPDYKAMSPDVGFQDRQSWLKKNLPVNEVVTLHPQKQLPFMTSQALEQVETILSEILGIGGEGVVLKKPTDLWLPERAWSCLKYKPWHDLEAKVVGYTTGRETDKGSKLLGMMGALICEIPAGRFKVSGFTDAERGFVGVDPYPGGILSGVQQETAESWASRNPDCETPDWISNPHFPRGSVVTIKYRELTDDGLPKEGRYWRKFNS